MRNLRFVLPVAALVGGAALVWANSLGAPTRVTGAPALGAVAAELTCNQVGCHVGNPMNSNGTLEILGVPETYTPATTYNLTVRLTSNATAGDVNRRWGFEVTAARLSDGQGTGSFIATGLRKVVGINSREYVTHNSASLQMSAASPVEWTFSWTSPATGEGSVGFYAAGNAANGNLLNAGDFIYTAGDTAKSMFTPVEPVTWGRLKGGKLFPR